MSRPTVFVVVLAAWSLAVLGPAEPAVAGERWRPPVDAAVVDPFRPPSHRYGPGNRGLEYGVDAGDPVRAVAGGVVRWSGVVAGRAYVSIDHGSGLWSTVGPLESRRVLRGATVRRGDPVGAATPGMHLTARLDRVYVDPQLLLDGAEVSVALVDGVAPPALRSAGPVRPAPAVVAGRHLGRAVSGVLDAGGPAVVPG